jgi:threonine dehydratase
VAALLSGRVEAGPGPVVAVVSGGNADPALLASVLAG